MVPDLVLIFKVTKVKFVIFDIGLSLDIEYSQDLHTWFPASLFLATF